jgi:SAM-dependent methyltransferase
VHSDETFWDECYRARPSLWSGEPNRNLVNEVSELSPGAALDVGAGEGADAIWLARRGWRVTALDISSVALQRAAANAAAAGDDLAAPIDWQHADVSRWDAGDRRFDLVLAQYLHLPAEQRPAVCRKLASLVRPGGTLLIVGHHVSDLHTTVPRPDEPELFFSGDEVLAALEPGQWQVITNSAPGRSTTDPDGNQVTVHDTVLRAHRSD